MTNKALKSIFLVTLFPFLLALTVGDVTVDSRPSANPGFSESYRPSGSPPPPPPPDPSPVEVVGNVTITWDALTVDDANNPVDAHHYEIRFRLTSGDVYTLITVPPSQTSRSIAVTSSGDYEGYIVGVATNGYVSSPTPISFTIN